jgi:hypothetical protein
MAQSTSTAVWHERIIPVPAACIWASWYIAKVLPACEAKLKYLIANL